MKSSQIPVVLSLAIPWILSTTAISLRFLARRVTKARLWWDDCMALFAYIWAVGNSAFGIKWVCDGLALHPAEIYWMSPSQSLKAARMNLFFLVLFYALAVGFAKLAVLALYWRIFSLGRLRYPIIVLAVCSVLWTVIRTTLGLVRCIPMYKYWDPSVPGRCPINDAKLFPGGAFSHLTLDLLIIALPLFELRKLRMSLGRKLGVMVLFMCGIITCIGTIFVIVGSLRLDGTSDEVSYNIQSLFIWANVEVNFGVVSACAPLLRPLFSICRNSTRSDDYDEFRSSQRQLFGGKMHSSVKQSTIQLSFPRLLAPTKLSNKWTSSSVTSTRGSSQTRSTMDSRAAVHPVSVLDDREYYQVPVMIPETVFEKPGQTAAEDLCLCATESGDDTRSRCESHRGVEGVERMQWDIWAGPSEDSANIPQPPAAVYPGDDNLQDNPNLRFLTVHAIV